MKHENPVSFQVGQCTVQQSQNIERFITVN